MRKFKIFKHLSESKLTEISHFLKKNHYTENQVIFPRDSIGEHLYLIFKGKVKVLINNRIIRELSHGSYFGELAILNYNDNPKRTADIIARENCTIYSIQKEIFMKFFDKKMQKIFEEKIALMDTKNISLESLFYINHLGEGKFGTVSLVNNSENFFAIKSVFRKYAENQKILTRYFQKERKILLSLEHNFIVKLIKTLKNSEYIFYLMEYVNGVVLSKYLEKKSENLKQNIYSGLYEAKFISACLLSVVDYLNFRKICHRDIKPDNIVIDDKGYVKLIDFGTAIEIKDFTNTISGTPHYIAPEILIGRGYGFSIDYWSIGITMFEILFDYYPFGNDAKDPMDVYREVMKK